MNNEERDALLHRVDKSTGVLVEKLENHINNKVVHHTPPCKAMVSIYGAIKAIILATIIGGGGYILSQVIGK